MAPFRRPGLQDDDDGELRPAILRPRHFPSMVQGRKDFPAPTTTPEEGHHPRHHRRAAGGPTRPPPRLSAASDGYGGGGGGEDDSVVSGLSAMSDLESVYVETSSKSYPRDAREHYLLAQRLPGRKAASGGGGGSYRRNNGRGGPPAAAATPLNGFVNGSGDGDDDDDDDDGEDDWQDRVYAATQRGRREPRAAAAPWEERRRIDPAEQERLDMNRAIAESRLQHEREQERKQKWMAQILEEDEPPEWEQEGSKKSKKSSKKKKKGGWWDLKSKRT